MPLETGRNKRFVSILGSDKFIAILEQKQKSFPKS